MKSLERPEISQGLSHIILILVRRLFRNIDFRGSIGPEIISGETGVSEL